MVEVGFDKQKRVFYRVDHKKVDRKVEFVLQKEGGELRLPEERTLLRKGDGRLEEEVCKRLEEAQEAILLTTPVLEESPLAQALEEVAKQKPTLGLYLLVGRLPEKLGARRLLGRARIRITQEAYASFLLVDPHLSEGGWGLLSCAPWTEEAFQESKRRELHLWLEARHIRSLAQWFAYHFWENAKEEVWENARPGCSAAEYLSFPKPDRSLYWGDPQHIPDDNVEDGIKEELLKNKPEFVWISTYKINHDSSLGRMLVSYAQNGGKLELFYPFFPEFYLSQAYPNLKYFVEAGATVRLFRAEPTLRVSAIYSPVAAFLLTSDIDEKVTKGTNFVIELRNKEQQEWLGNWFDSLRKSEHYFILRAESLQNIQKYYEVKKGELIEKSVKEEFEKASTTSVKRAGDLVRLFEDMDQRQWEEIEREVLSRQEDVRNLAVRREWELEPAPSELKKLSKLAQGLWKAQIVPQSDEKQAANKKSVPPKEVLLIEANGLTEVSLDGEWAASFRQMLKQNRDLEIYLDLDGLPDSK